MLHQQTSRAAGSSRRSSSQPAWLPPHELRPASWRPTIAPAETRQRFDDAIVALSRARTAVSVVAVAEAFGELSAALGSSPTRWMGARSARGPHALVSVSVRSTSNRAPGIWQRASASRRAGRDAHPARAGMGGGHAFVTACVRNWQRSTAALASPARLLWSTTRSPVRLLYSGSR